MLVFIKTLQKVFLALNEVNQLVSLFLNGVAHYSTVVLTQVKAALPHNQVGSKSSLINNKHGENILPF